MTTPPRIQPGLSDSLGSAARIVAAVLAGRTPDATLAQTALPLRPATLDLAYTTLRDFGRGDFLLGRLLSKPLKETGIRALLLVALARLERRPEDAHTIVDQAVGAAAGIAGGRLKGLTNAVLRNFLRQRDDLLTAADADAVAHWRHPAWWLDALREVYPARWEEIAAAGNSHPPLCLRINRRRTTSADFISPPRSQTRLAAPHGGDVGLGRPSADYYAQELAAAGIKAQVLDDTALLLDKPLPVERLPGFAEGRVSVQDWGAQHAATLLDLSDGQRVLDACAAPGGKTAHILEHATVQLTALELDPQRSTRIEQNLQRLGLSATLLVGDACQPAAWWNGQRFDRILADVPCSASGVVRRHPDIKWLRRPADVAGFVRTQAAILDALWPLLAPGGKMLYCTCSVFPQENDDQMRAFVARHPDSRRRPTGSDAPELQLLPSATHDGFYYALLEKMP
ncbi:MAG: 16S rRNA (cytosine(967)-C(5))-methyltransferase RsmB [Gammaproteobacteria bacterium]|nr:16S rRNA (cytosine(967)-C(5))-methyltransferase RsmB [Rhodocyclaceae bacterium]MBU3909259.1 16S rRNA (cytosine(967)-C(5))-methyltransferase RsmB [Gammaproteobacteria bacterium]MBU3989633.1 16S rRNA (cytosine(967)-C(5))-methyltransferase RsmB [Gammaproteobacteria bacterium]MBU4005581.1 16S rRNA (cytosine(967)-C(5))-methyltransferase RsmB [Gammaproteobacteria bacterium]MBU4020866.1 16S rRNA (cytosine(967)-C(5))-methyltransferase RsmB [Gammaproteobacteria bacterium]